MSFATKDFEKTSLARVVKNATGVSVQRCYQCGKCSAGCPVASEMDDPPSVLLRLLQSDTETADVRVLRSYAIWLCLMCHECVARCPMEVDLPRIMDALRAESMRQKLVHPRARKHTRVSQIIYKQHSPLRQDVGNRSIWRVQAPNTPLLAGPCPCAFDDQEREALALA